MKILHVLSSDSGGAGIAAINLHKALLRQNIDSKVLCLTKDGSKNEAEVYQFRKKYPSITRRLLNKVGIYKLNSHKNDYLYQKAKGEFDALSFPDTDFDITEDELFKHADIINLHWVGNFIDFSTFFDKNDKATIWTMHDKNPFLGCFHLLLDMKRENNMKDINANLQKYKRQKINIAKHLTFVSPSVSLQKFIEGENISKNIKVRQIFNSIDMSVFKILDSTFAKRYFGVSETKKIVLSIAYRVEIHHKGFDLLLEAMKFVKNKDVEYVFISDNSFEIDKGLSVKYIKPTYDSRLLALIYAVADIFVISSREENLPNVMLECMACGKPVLSFPVGGMSDVIISGENGILSSQLSSLSLAESLNDFLDNKYNFEPQKIRQFAVTNFSPEGQAEKYIQLYKECITSIIHKIC